MPLFRTQSAVKQTSHAPHDSKARLQNVTNCRRLMAKPCTPHLIPQAAQLFKIETTNVGGRGVLPSRSLGGVRGDILFLRKENIPPWCCGAHAAYPSALCAESNRSPEGAQKRSSPFGLPLFYFSQMTGFWRSDSTKALAFSTASARGSFTCSPVRMSLQDTTPAVISSSPRK